MAPSVHPCRGGGSKRVENRVSFSSACERLWLRYTVYLATPCTFPSSLARGGGPFRFQAGLGSLWKGEGLSQPQHHSLDSQRWYFCLRRGARIPAGCFARAPITHPSFPHCLVERIPEQLQQSNECQNGELGMWSSSKGVSSFVW